MKKTEKRCAVCGAVSPEDAMTCPLCGEGSWEKAAAASPSRAPQADEKKSVRPSKKGD